MERAVGALRAAGASAGAAEAVTALEAHVAARKQHLA
jgi:hypothetical protein